METSEKYGKYDYRGFTVESLGKLIDDCFLRAKANNVHLFKKGVPGRCFGVIKEGNDIIFSKEYNHKYDFMNTAHIFMDFYFLLEHISKVTIRTRNDRNRRFGNLQAELNFNYNIYQIDR